MEQSLAKAAFERLGEISVLFIKLLSPASISGR